MIKSGPPDEGVSASGRDQPLFRAEVISEQQTRFLGTVLLAPKISHSLFALFAALAATALLGLLFFGEYTRKERISGWLVPERGLIRIFAPEAAVVTELKVKDGDMVARGLPLLTLSTERQSSALGATQEEIVRRLTSRRDSMLAEREMRAQLDRDEVTSLTQRLAAIGDEQGHRRQEIQLQRERVQLAKEAVERSGRLREQGLLPAQLWQEAEDSRLDQSLRLAELEREQAEVERERQEVAAELKALPLRSRTALAAIERDVAALEQDLAEAEARRQIVLAAPQAGRITTVQTEPGGNADPAVPLLSIVPQGSALVAQLFIPTNAIGFIQPGQPVMLRYRPFVGAN